jgi:hypothetical protein
MSTARTAEIALLRCPHIDQPPLSGTWFRAGCMRCNEPCQVPKREFDRLAARRMVAIVCFECWTREDRHPTTETAP